MRQVVDKHFYDNWVIPFYLGYTVDLTNEWAPYTVTKFNHLVCPSLQVVYIAQ